jgi:hypothetical protein
MQSLVAAIPHLHNPADINQIHADIRNLVSTAGIRNVRHFCVLIYQDLYKLIEITFYIKMSSNV